MKKSRCLWKKFISELSCAQKSLYISSYLLASTFSSSLQSYKKFSVKSVLKLFEFNSTFKDSHMIVFYILRQAQFKVSALALIDSDIFAYVFMNKSFAQQHRFSLHLLTYSHRFQEFNDQVALIDNITYVVKFTMIINHLMKSAKTDYKLIKLASVKNICLVELLAHKL